MLRLAAVAYICFVVHWMICDVRRDHKAVEAVGGLAPVLAKEWQALPAPTVCIASPFDIPELDYTVPPPLEASRGGPCLVHQAQLPDQWKINSRAWKTLAQSVPGCQYVFWSDARLRLLIARYYPWFLTAYDAYPYPIQRVDAARYFILYSYGGLYADLDMLPKPTMAAVLARPTDQFVFDHGMGLGVSNDLMLAPPDHPFAALLLTRLRPNSISLLFPYLTVLSTTGSLFCTVNLDLFNRDLAIKRNKFWAVESRRDGHAPTGRQLVAQRRRYCVSRRLWDCYSPGQYGAAGCFVVQFNLERHNSCFIFLILLFLILHPTPWKPLLATCPAPIGLASGRYYWPVRPCLWVSTP